MNDMTSYTARFNTFEGGETHGIDHQTRLRLAKCGFYYRGSGKSVACFKCRRNFDEWDRVHEVIDEHKERSPDCCRGIQEAEINQRRNNDERGGSHAGYYGSTDQQANDYQMMNFTDHQPKFQNFCSLSQRLRTFLHWQYPVSPIVLAEAGLFSTVYNDEVRCFYCGYLLHALHLADDPSVEHLPECGFARTIQTDMSIDDTIPSSPRDHHRVVEHQTTNGHTQIGQHRTIPTFEQMRAESIENAYSKRLQQLNKRILEERMRREKLEQMYEELCCHHQCIICIEGRPDTLLLPCKHQYTCFRCASQLDKCCVCRRPIRQKYRAYLP